MKKLLIFVLQIATASCIFAISLKEIDENFLRKYLPDYKTSKIFGPQYMKLLSRNPTHQIEATEDAGGKYVLIEDFDGDGRNEIAISGLVNEKPINGKITGFVAIFSEVSSGYKNVYIQEFIKPIESNGTDTISNLALFVNRIENKSILEISFRLETGWMFRITWIGNKFEGKELSY